MTQTQQTVDPLTLHSDIPSESEVSTCNAATSIDDINSRLAVVQKMIDSNTGDSACYIEACKLLLEAGCKDEAQRYYEDACELDPTNPELQNIARSAGIQSDEYAPAPSQVHTRIIASIQQFGMNNEQIRNAWVKQTLQKIPRGMHILDAGAGEQRYREFCSHLEYTAQDFGKYDGRGDSVGLQNQALWDTSKNQIVSDIVDIPVPDRSFDAIMCTEVFEHLPEPVKALKEFSRILGPGGHLILTAPVCSLTHQSPYYFYNGFSRYFYEKFLPDYGFRIIEITPSGSYPEYLAQELMRIPSIAKCYCGVDTSAEVINSIRMILSKLYECHLNDKGSSELLSYGYHVYAVKEA